MAGDRLNVLKKSLELSREEVDFLAAIAKRAYQSVLSHEVRDLTTGRNVGPLKKLHVASLAVRLPDPEQHIRQVPSPFGSCRLGPNTYTYVSFDSPEEEIPAIADKFLTACRDQGFPVHFVLLNELAHAFSSQRLAAAWSHLALKHEAYIVPGTYHCPDELYCVAPIYAPRRRPDNVLKQNSAIRQGEKIRTPDVRELFTYKTDFGNIVVWICLDIYDPGLILKFLNITNRFAGDGKERARRKREISLVLVPSYNGDQSQNVETCIQSVSRFSRTAMVCANAYTDEERPGENRLESFGFVGGEPLRVRWHEEFRDVRTEEVACRACLYEVDLEALRETQARNYGESGLFSSPFTAIVQGGGYVVRDLPD